MMRADPDVIMVGEIRDRDTAKIAIEGAMTGHLVLTTLHTNDAPTAITRLIEMGVEPFLVASAVNAVVAQRLVRVLCPACKRPVTLRADVLRGHGFAVDGDVDAFEPVGCGRCSGTGFRGRLGLFELMTVSSAVRELTLGHASSDEIGRIAMAEGMRRLADDAIEKIRGGVTSVDEALRVTGGG
jgi:type IV pilus assembly protein PilB